MSSKFEKLLLNYVFNVSELCQVFCPELCQVFAKSPPHRDTLVTPCYEVTSCIHGRTCNMYVLHYRRTKAPRLNLYRYIGNRGSLVYIVLFQAMFWLNGCYSVSVGSSSTCLIWRFLYADSFGHVMRSHIHSAHMRNSTKHAMFYVKKLSISLIFLDFLPYGGIIHTHSHIPAHNHHSTPHS